MNIALPIAAIVSFLSFVVMTWLYVVAKKRSEEKSVSMQKDQIERHYNEIKNIYATMRGWRHDYHNHIQTMKAHLALKQHNELGHYLDSLDTDLEQVDVKIKTGNIMVDAILNSKVSLAENNNINVNVKAYVQEKISTSDVDLCVIIGNLIDNAIDACLDIENVKERFIRIYIGKLKEQLYISVTNSTAETKRNDSNIFVSKKGGLMHGHGLKRVDATVAKYDGYLNRQNESGVFSTEILLPI